jgi:hypothetical protein
VVRTHGYDSPLTAQPMINLHPTCTDRADPTIRTEGRGSAAV